MMLEIRAPLGQSGLVTDVHTELPSCLLTREPLLGFANHFLERWEKTLINNVPGFANHFLER
jgi:hypothetical protein